MIKIRLPLDLTNWREGDASKQMTSRRGMVFFFVICTAIKIDFLGED